MRGRLIFSVDFRSAYAYRWIAGHVWHERIFIERIKCITERIAVTRDEIFVRRKSIREFPLVIVHESRIHNDNQFPTGTERLEYAPTPRMTYDEIRGSYHRCKFRLETKALDLYASLMHKHTSTTGPSSSSSSFLLNPFVFLPLDSR